MRKPLIAVAALGVFGLAAGLWFSSAGESTGAGFFPYDQPGEVAAGAALYDDYCAACHGAQLEGEPNWRDRDADGYLPAPPHDETGHTWHHSNRQLFEYTALGGEEVIRRMGVRGFKSGMPSFGETLSEDEIWDVLAFIQSTWPDRVKELQASRNAPHE